MKIAVLSTSRADYSALMVARLALMATKEHTLTSMVYHTHPSFATMRDDLRAAETDLVLIHGDRWDALLGATAATVAQVPIGHIGGGDVTRGSYDDRFRDAITMLSDWHFVSTAQAALRLSQLVDSGRVSVIGELAIDWLASVDLTDATRALDVRLGLHGRPYILVNWQPETGAEVFNSNDGLRLIIDALRLRDHALVFVRPGEDAGGLTSMRLIKDFRTANPRVRYIEDGMSRAEYAAALKHCVCMVGNSSSGLIEAPVFRRPFVLVGSRQDGRPIPGNTHRAPLSTSAEALALMIDVAVEAGKIFSNDVSLEGNPYGDGKAGEKLVAAVRRIT